jgi:type I restriction enzyme S subunit
MIKVVLSSVIDIISGGTPQTSVEEYWNDGNIGWLSVTDFNNDLRYVYDSEKKITEKGLKESNTKLLKFGDIIISARGTVGALAQIGTPMCFNQSCFGIRGKKEEVNTDFLYYSLKNYVQHIKKRSQGSVFDTINLKSFDLMELEIPSSINIQQKIAKVLSDLDAKIELNNRINSELESMAKTLYDYWFVQFDFPFDFAQGRPDANGKPYKISGGKMVWNEALKREIPEGWEVKDLGDLINIFDSKRIPLSRTQREKRIGKIPYYGATSVMGYVDDYIFDDEYILLAEDGSVMDEKGFPIVQFIWGKTWVNNHAHVLQAKNITNNEFVFHLVKTISVIQIITGSIQLKINQENLRNVKVILPDEYTLKNFSKFTTPIRKKLINNIEENQELASLRDWLLPMLMNGQVSVGEVEEQLGMVAESGEKYGE